MGALDDSIFLKAFVDYDRLLFVSVLLLTTCHAQNLTYLGALPMNHPGFSIQYDHGDVIEPTERYSILQTTFSATTDQREDVNMIEFPGKCLDEPQSCDVYNVGDDFDWPRKPGQIPENIFGFSDAAHITDGFLIPEKRDGAVYLADLRDKNNSIITDITTGAIDDGFEWFYQQALWYDADNDGLQDLFTCRTRVQTFPPNAWSQFLWYKNPGGDDAMYSGPWELGLIISEDECDTALRMTQLNVDGNAYDVIYTTGYFSNTFNAYWTDDADGLWTDPSTINSRLIDVLVDDLVCDIENDKCGHFFDLEILDLNLDSRLDILMTINSGVYGQLVSYEIPDDFRVDNYTVYTLAEGFIPRSGADNPGSPGSTYPFYPTTETTGKPWIMLSGDDDGRAYYLIPESDDVTNWQYELVEFLDQGPEQIVAVPLPFDANGDGFTDVFVPCWTANDIKFFSFAP